MSKARWISGVALPLWVIRDPMAMKRTEELVPAVMAYASLAGEDPVKLLGRVAELVAPEER